MGEFRAKKNYFFFLRVALRLVAFLAALRLVTFFFEAFFVVFALRLVVAFFLVAFALRLVAFRFFGAGVSAVMSMVNPPKVDLTILNQRPFSLSVF